MAFEKCCLNIIKVEPYWDAKNFFFYAGWPLQTSIVLIAVYYFAAPNYPIRAKKRCPQMLHKSTKEVISDSTILLSSSVEQNLASIMIYNIS